jgi:hypothetical protein
MAQKKVRVKVNELKGVKLYNYLLRELGNLNSKLPNQQKLSIQSKRAIISKEVFPKYKAQGNIILREIKKDLNKIVKALPPREICNPLYLSEAYLSFVEYYEIDNHIKTVLPDCLDIKIDANGYGKTKIFNTRNYSYYGNGVKKIIEKIREDAKNRPSGDNPYFSGIVKLKPRKKNNGDPDNYYVEYILYIQNEPVSDDEQIDYELPKKEKKKVEEIKDYLADKFKTLQKEKRKRIRKAIQNKPKKPAEQKKEINTAIRVAINSLKSLLKKGVITKAQFDKQKTEINAYKKLKK